jgi:tetratricopeptide (TPR) repeat protein
MTKSQSDDELALWNAHIAAQSQRYDAALHFLAQLDPAALSNQLQINYYHTTGDARLGQNNYEGARTALEAALKLLDSYTLDELDYDVLLKREQIRNAIGLTYYHQHRPDEALEHHRQCLQAMLARQVTDRRFCFKVYTNLGNDYYQIRNYERALEMYRQSLELISEQEEETGRGEDRLNLAAIYWGMGLIYRGREDFGRTKNFFARSAEIYEAAGETRLLALVNNLLALVMIDREELREAEPLLIASRDSAAQHGYTETLANVSVNMAYLYFKQERWAEGRDAARQGETLARQLGNLTLLAQALAQLAQIEFAGKLASDHQITHTYDEAMAIVESTNSLEYKYRLSKRGYELFSEMRDFQRAMTCLEKMHRYEAELKPGVN